jgi:hypothetical protein
MAIEDFIDINGGGVGLPDSVFPDSRPPVQGLPMTPQAAPQVATQASVTAPEAVQEDEGCSMEVDGLLVDDDGGCTEVAPPPTFAVPVAAPARTPKSPPKQTQVPALPPPEADFLGAMSGSLPNAATPEIKPEVVAPAVPVQVTAEPTTAPSPAPIFMHSPPPEVVATAPVVAQDFKDVADKTQDLQSDIIRLKNLLGINVMEDPRTCDPQNVIHVAIWNMRHNPVGLVQMTASQLCIFESALSAHQVYVQCIENEWAARYAFLGREFDRVMRKCRRKYRGDTEKDREEACLDAEPAMAKLRNEFLKAQAFAALLEDMGDRFAQLEDGLKRTISMRHEEEKRSYQQAKWQQ